MTLWGERIAAILCILFALFMAYNAWDFPAAGEQFPFFSCSVIILISVLMLIRSYFQPGVFTEKYPFKISYEDLKPLIITGIVTDVYKFAVLDRDGSGPGLVFIYCINNVISINYPL